MIATKRIITIAADQIGITEYPANSNNVKFNTWFYGKAVSGKNFAWCMAFVQWCFDQAKMTLPFRTASCSALLNWYRKNMPECVVTSPQPGDIIIYNFGHTGIVESVGKDTITTIEGNTSPGDSGSQDNGGGVFRRKRKTSLVTAYIRPYHNDETENDDMTLDKFKELWKEMRKELQDNDSGKWSEEARQWATSTGLIAGNGEVINGEPNYMWADILTREQFVTVLYRFANMMGKV